ncbi:amidase [Ramlibacter alkalitolerans]|uniref:Amidase n=1 Tax=Ramlibacter alkalitolerans TaxID=2039631 RepID=A0ABS1JRB7_9BURK|nr:amidase family protein [Ramlibacter alkalitolerans]MBL0426814.1 amidase [Ramlibacter alkalitolerans]
MDLSHVTQASAAEIAAAVRRREITAVAVMRTFLDRIEQLEPRFNTFATLTAEAALQQAHHADKLIAGARDPGPLAGVPVSVKDLIAVRGVRQAFGSKLLADNVAQHDAPAVERLHHAGACIVGKSTTSELGSKAVGDSPLTGVTRNPWNAERTPGGSSSGAAAQVAARMVPVALATDGGGSIRIPSSFCGVFGIKARFGRVPVWPPSAAPALAHVGPITHSVRDAALVLSVIAGRDARDEASLRSPVPDFLASLDEGLRGLRIGWCPALGYGRADAAVLEACEQAAWQLQAEGAQVMELQPPFARDPGPAWNRLFYGRIGERLAELAPTPAQRELVNPALRAAVAQLEAFGPPAEAELAALREETWARAQSVFRTVDVLLTPTLPVTALPVGVDVPPGHAGRNAVDWSYFTYPFNLTGHPAASFPVGFDGGGLPIGLQIVGPLDGEGAILRVASAIERLHPIAAPRLV